MRRAIGIVLRGSCRFSSRKDGDLVATATAWTLKLETDLPSNWRSRIKIGPLNAVAWVCCSTNPGTTRSMQDFNNVSCFFSLFCFLLLRSIFVYTIFLTPHATNRKNKKKNANICTCIIKKLEIIWSTLQRTSGSRIQHFCPNTRRL